jgi:hypothetical protein
MFLSIWPSDKIFRNTGWVARRVVATEQPLAKGFKRGGACLFAHSHSCNEATQATRRGFGRRTWEITLVISRDLLGTARGFALRGGRSDRRRVTGIICA